MTLPYRLECQKNTNKNSWRFFSCEEKPVRKRNYLYKKENKKHKEIINN